MFDLYNISQKTNDAEVKAKLTDLVRVAVERAESLKGIKSPIDDSVITSLAKLPPVPETNFPDTIPPVNASATPTSKYKGRRTQSYNILYYIFNQF